MKGMVSTASKTATEAGVRMLELGGNAVDAAVAAAFCLGVSEPQASGIGGQSMALLHFREGNRSVAIDGSSRAPFGIDPNSIPEKAIKWGVNSTTVPSTPAVLGYLLDTYGTLSLSQVLAPSIEAAEEGFKVTALQHRLIMREKEKLIQDQAVAKLLFPDGKPLRAGQILKQPQLAKTLKGLAERGWEDFYQGEISEEIVKDMENRGGIIGRVDLNQIPIPVERDVLKGSYRSLKIETFPPPGAGESLIQILNILENFSKEELDLSKPLGVLITALAFKIALRDRERMPIDPALYLQSADKVLTDKSYAKEISGRLKNIIDKKGCMWFVPPETSGETTHLSVVDSHGNMVGITQSIELVFGSKTIAKDLGFFYNNYMAAFNYRDITHPYYLLPGARPWSSVAPTIVYKDNRPELLLGSPGSERIATSLAQVLTRMYDGGQSLEEAINAPRLHASAGGKVSIERDRFSPQVIDALERAGFKLANRGSYSFYLGCIQAVMLSEEGKSVGISDRRRDGSASGPEKIGGERE
ncbi:gamma-glutamyltranspeptidase/glutathione hydrolase [Desulfitispora alkaliphila]|uniref:gamma-glutamyltransferase n=1 Tax=Desulfitispora alkaliphila TaxID=622674 RepID=UPI003D1F9035